jgi:hypothetical protein
MTTPPTPPPYGPIPTGEESRLRADLASPSLYLAIATVVVTVVLQLSLQIYIRTIDSFDAGSYGVLSALANGLSLLVAIAALIVGFVALGRGGSNKAAPGAAIGIGGLVIIETVIYLPFAWF